MDHADHNRPRDRGAHYGLDRVGVLEAESVMGFKILCFLLLYLLIDWIIYRIFDFDPVIASLIAFGIVLAIIL